MSRITAGMLEAGIIPGDLGAFKKEAGKIKLYMGGGGGQPTQSTSYTTNVPEYARPYVENMLESTQKQIYTDDMTGFRPYRPYSTDVNDYFAGFSPLQRQAQQTTAGLQTPGQFGDATTLAGTSGLGALGLAGQAAGAGQQYARNVTDPSMMQSYMSPYQQSVTDIAKMNAVREAQIAQNMQNLGAARQGTYGGARQTLAQAEREKNLLSNLSNIQAQGSQSAFDRAMQAQQFGSTLGMQGLQTGLQGYGQAGQAASTLGQLGGQQLGAQKEIIGLQSQMGREMQGQEQSKINQAIQDYAIAQQYPFMQLGQMNAMLRGLPLQTQTTQLYQAQPSALQQGIGLAGAAGTFFGGRNREGGIVGYAPGGVIDNTRADLEQIADMPGGMQKLEEIRNSSSSKEVRKMAGEIIAQKQVEARAEQQSQTARMGGIAAAGGGLFDTMGYAGGGILAFQEGGMGMTNPEFGGGVDPNMDQNRLDSLQLQKDIEKYNFLKDASPVAAERLLASNPILRDKVTPAAPAAAAPKPEAKPPAAKPEGGAPVDRSVAAATGMKSLEEQMREQERLMGPNTANEGLNAKIAERLAGMSKREKQDELAAIRNAFIKFGTEASPGGIGVAALKGIGSYGDASDAAKKAREGMDLELTKMQADIKKGERAEKRGNLDAAAKAFESAENRKLRLDEMQNQLKVAGIQASRSSEFEKQYAQYAADEKAAGRTPTFEGFKRAASLQDDAAKATGNREAAKAFAAQEFTNFGGDKKYIELKKAAQSGDAAAVKAFNDYRMQQFQNIRNMIIDPEKAIGGGSAAIPEGVTVKKVG